jgi:hypothetical protein
VTLSVHVTEHALARWRERVAPGPDAPLADLVAAVRAAHVIRPGSAPAGLVMRPGSAYRRDAADPLVVYVLDPVEGYHRVARLVTVYRVGEPPRAPSREVGKAAKRKAKLWTAKGGAS